MDTKEAVAEGALPSSDIPSHVSLPEGPASL
jgi:hypothetical protein